MFFLLGRSKIGLILSEDQILTDRARIFPKTGKEQVMSLTDVQSIFSLTLHQEINVESLKK
jgi:hypothetical protein